MLIEEADKISEELWNKDAGSWNTYWAPIFQRFAHDLVSEARISTGHIVLDIGTGTGIAAIEASKRVRPGGIVLGIDRSAPILAFAEANLAKLKNVCFFKMNSDRMTFREELFDAVISNCGISYPVFPQTIAEAFRVLRKGGSFTFSDWHLIDVPAHRRFSEILQKYRTDHPSKKLTARRTAISMIEHTGNLYTSSETQTKELQRVGFTNVKFNQRRYTIKLPSVRAYLAMRLEREALRQELHELSGLQRNQFMTALKIGLKPFVRNKFFIIDWRVAFTHADKER